MSAHQMKTHFAIPASLAGLLLLSACSTVQENPNYQFSSKYQTPDTLVMAEATPPAQTQGAEIQGNGLQTAPVVSASNAVQPPSPTEEAYNADAMVGTPGYAILMAEEAEAAEQAPAPVYSTPAPQPHAPYARGPREVTYDYAQNVILGDNPTPAPVPAPQVVAPISTPVTAPTAQTYTVQPGDTIYSLSRRLCAPIGELMSVNGIGSDFAIKIGQTLSLPASRC